MDNKQIAAVFEEMGNILDIAGANFFRVNAYRKGALTVLNLPYDLRETVKNDPDSLADIPGIGKALHDKIIELVETGKCKEHERLKKSIPEGLLEVLEIRGLGPKKVKALYTELAVKSIADLKKVAEKGLVRELPKMGEKTEKEILKAIEEHKMFSTERSGIDEAILEARRIVKYMEDCGDIKQLQYAGSLRRWQETIGDIDVLVTVKDPEKSREKVMEYFVRYDEVFNVIAQGDTKSSVILKSGIQVDLRVINDESFGAALHYFTGSKEHNVRIRDIAKKKGMKVNEYGVFKGEKMIAGKTEEELFKAVGLPFIPPEMRRNDGEVEYALNNGKLLALIELSDIKGDCHVHSTYSDGKHSIEEMAQAMMERGYEYFAMTDHSKTMGITQGMDAAKARKQWKEIEKVQKKFNKIKILRGSEVDILKDGDLDFEEEILKEMDIVLISAHMYRQQEHDAQTKRLIKAIENPYSKVLAHPTGRLIGKRAQIEFDMNKVIEACVQNKVALEINSSPSRLDLLDKYVRVAKEKRAKFIISTDSHSKEHPAFMEFGVGIARRGWLEKQDVLNAQKLEDMLKYWQ